MSCPVSFGGDPSAGEGKSPPIPSPGRRATRRRPMRSAPTGASARRVDACLNRCVARALLAATVALPLLASEVAAAPPPPLLHLPPPIPPPLSPPPPPA